MKYSPQQYASALNAALAEKAGKERQKTLQRFLKVLRSYKDTAKLGAILAKMEKEWLKTKGITKVEIESAAPLSSGTKKEIESALGKKLFLKKKVNPELLAGFKILVNGENLVDASGKRRIERLFAN